MSLWKDDKAPLGNGKFEAFKVELTVYPVKSEKPAPVFIICPGGGYGGHAINPEGYGIGKWLNEQGIAGVVVKYRLPKGRSLIPLIDVQRAIRLTRFNAKKWNVNPKQLGIIGFSAGGHLASTALNFSKNKGELDDDVDKLSCRPDFGLLVYPVISMGKYTHKGSKIRLIGKSPSEEMVTKYSGELQVSKDTPPTFLAHALDDKPVPPENSEMFYNSLVKNGVKAKYLKLPNGGHGLNGYKGPSWDAWQKQSIEWFRQEKLID